jgi:chemotaxis protein CheD
MERIVLGVGEYLASRTPGIELKTFALGSCIAVIMLDPATHTIGMAHIALPDSKISPDKVKDMPAYFADTGIPMLLRSMNEVGEAERKNIVVKLVGGASVMDPDNTFNIGKRNVLAVKKTLWKYGMGPIAEDVGGSISRTVAVEVDTGKIFVSSPGREVWNV